LQLVRAEHGPAILTFELDNREYFAESISDRGDDYFSRFTELHHELLAQQATGACADYVLVENDGGIAGRFNLYRIHEGTADLGYRVARQAAGHGAATAAVIDLCRLAVIRHGLFTLRAATSDHNFASRRVLIKAGFILDGPAEPAEIGGKQGHWYRKNLSAAAP